MKALHSSNIKNEDRMKFMKAQVDKILEKYLSRKLMVWLTSTAFLAFDKLSGDEWVAIALTYIGSQALVEIATKWKAAGRNLNQD